MEVVGPNSNSKAASDVSQKGVEEKTSLSLIPSRSSEGVIPPKVPQSLEDSPMASEGPILPEVPKSLEGSPAANADHDLEYNCKYCHKKFTNKQALGGHQNAHKVERAIEKNARQNHFGYVGGTSSYLGLTSAPFLGSHNRSHEFKNRSIVNRLYPSRQLVQHGIHISYNSRPRQPMSHEPYVPRPLPGFTNVYSGWVAPIPENPQFIGNHSYMQNHGLPTTGAGSSSARPSLEGLPPFTSSKIRPQINREGKKNNQINDDPASQQLEDSDLDLSLKL